MAEPIDKDTRGPVNLRIKFRSESLQQFIERYGVDVSRGGIFIRTREPLPVGTRLKLDFQLVDAAPLFQGDGTVVWIREHDASRAGVTPGMGVRFDRLTPESQTTLDTILEEKIRLQQSGVAPGSVAKAGAGIAVRRPSGAFATLDAPAAEPAMPPPLPVEVKLDAEPPPTAAPPVGAAPVERHARRVCAFRAGERRRLEQHLHPAARDQRHAHGREPLRAVRGAHGGGHRQGAVRAGRKRRRTARVARRPDGDQPVRIEAEQRRRPDQGVRQRRRRSSPRTKRSPGPASVVPETGIPVSTGVTAI